MNLPPSRHSLTLRLALLFAVLSTLILLGLGLFVQQAIEGHFLEQDEEELYGQLTLVRRILADTPDGQFANAVPQLETLMSGTARQSLSVLDASDAPVFSNTPQPPRWLLQKTPAAADDLAPATHLGHGDLAHTHESNTATHSHNQATSPAQSAEQRGILALARLQDGAVVKVAIAMSVAHHLHFMAGFMRSFAWALALAVVANALCAAYAARRGLLPLETMATLARHVSGEQLHERLTIENLPSELQALGRDLNAMLERLEEAFTRLSSFASDIAHELRTPVTALMTQAQVALAQPRSPEEYREALYSSLEECEHLTTMISDMLFLAQTENGLMLLRRENVDLTALLHALTEFYGILADEKAVGLTVEGAASVTGDALMLRRALGNLISNAIRHTPTGGQIRIELETTANQVTISVENPGEPIAQQHLEHIFERFYRVDPARQRTNTGGQGSNERTGLGLAIARSIAIAHGGNIAATCAGGRTRFTLRLPTPSPSGRGSG
jgi:two-component system heavy metal sensor histidine kinase CusS